MENIIQRENIMSDTKLNKNFFRVSAEDFKKIPGSPIAYWVSEGIRDIFKESVLLKEIGDTRQGMASSNNNKFLRLWGEVSYNNICLDAKTRKEALQSNKTWFPYNKGGAFRKWYGN